MIAVMFVPSADTAKVDGPYRTFGLAKSELLRLRKLRWNGAQYFDTLGCPAVQTFLPFRCGRNSSVEVEKPLEEGLMAQCAVFTACCFLH